MATFHGNWSLESARYPREYLQWQEQYRLAQLAAQMAEMERQQAEAMRAEPDAGGPIIEGEYVDITDRKAILGK